MTAPLFPLLHDGGSPSTERIEAGTAVNLSHNGTESRQATRDLPRVTLSATYKARSTGAGAVALALIQGGGLVHVPLGCHAATAGAADALDQGLNSDNLQSIVGLADGSAVLNGVLDPLPVGARWVAPSADAWLAGSREIQWLGGDSKLWSAQLSFELTSDYREVLPVLVGPLSFPEHYGIGVKPVETRSATQDRLDFGRRWLLEQRYIKRAARITVAISGRDAIKQFRAFIYACKGRLNSFSYRLPADSIAKTWRLGTDAVEIEYRSRRLAVCALELVEVDE